MKPKESTVDASWKSEPSNDLPSLRKLIRLDKEKTSNG